MVRPFGGARRRRGLFIAAVVAFAAGLGLAEPVGAKDALSPSFSPAPEGLAYAAVWAGVDTTMMLAFAEGNPPDGDVETIFT